jgi:hypothetical protein
LTQLQLANAIGALPRLGVSPPLAATPPKKLTFSMSRRDG